MLYSYYHNCVNSRFSKIRVQLCNRDDLLFLFFKLFFIHSNLSSSNDLYHFLYFYSNVLDYNSAIFAILSSVAHPLKKSPEVFLTSKKIMIDNNNEIDH